MEPGGTNIIYITLAKCTAKTNQMNIKIPWEISIAPVWFLMNDCDEKEEYRT